MKSKLKFVSVCLLATNALLGQSEFKKEWETKASVENKWNDQNDDLSYVLLGDLKEIEMVDGVAGKSLWKFNAKEKLGVKSMEDWFFLWAKEGEPVEVVYKKPKEDAKTSIFLNPKTGEVMSSVTEATLVDKKASSKKSKAKTIYANSVFDDATNTLYKITYKDKLAKSASGSEMELTVSASGDNNWTANLKAKCVVHLCTDLLSSNEPDVMINVLVMSGKLFVVYEGISVYDIKNGTLLWSTTFDNVQTSTGLKAVQEIGRSAMPVANKEAVFLCDFSKGEKSIKKLDINTGNLIWKSDKLSNDDVVSQLLITENNLIAKFGGLIRIEKFIPNANGGVGDGTYKVYSSYEGNTDIVAYDLTSGKQIWNSEKLASVDKISKAESNMLMVDGKIVACGEKQILFIEPATGNIAMKTDYGSKEIAKAKYLWMYNDNIIIEGEKGIASISKSAAKNYSAPTGKCLFTEFKGNAFIVWVGKDYDDMNQFIRFDLTSGKTLGMLKGTYRPRFDKTGDYFIRYNENVITKFKTN